MESEDILIGIGINVAIFFLFYMLILSDRVKRLEKYHKEYMNRMKDHMQEQMDYIKKDIRKIEQKLDRIRGG